MSSYGVNAVAYDRGLEGTVQKWPQVHQEEVVDDISLQRISTSEARVVDDLVGAVKHLAGVTKDLGLQLQGKKCAIVARDSRLAERLVSRRLALSQLLQLRRCRSCPSLDGNPSRRH